MSQEQLTSTSNTFRVGEWIVNPALDEISRKGELVRLEPRTMKTLVCLANAAGRVVSPQQLLNTVWSGVIVGPASVYQAISQLRKALGDTDPDPTYIATIPRKGYRLVAPVEYGPAIAPTPSTSSNASTSTPPSTRRFDKRHWLFAAVIALFAIGITTVAVIKTPKARQVSPASTVTAALDSRTIVVLPFTATTQDESTQILAPIATDLLRTRLAKLPDLIVIADDSTKHAARTQPDTAAIANALHARYVLRGELAGLAERLRVRIWLQDMGASRTVWSSTFERAISDLPSVSNEIVRDTARVLEIDFDSSAGASADGPVNAAAYQLYLRGQELRSTTFAESAREASVILSRVTTLDPTFAKGYLAYGETLLLAADLGAIDMSEELAVKARKAFERALELNPTMGEPWAQLARLTSDPVAAEELYRRAIKLTPGYAPSYIRYSDLLLSQRRRGEARELIDHARRLDPLSSGLVWREAQLIMLTTADLAEYERVLRDGLKQHPDLPGLLRYLGMGKWLWTGEFAEGVRLVERAFEVDPGGVWAVGPAVVLYLEVEDPDAATNILEASPRAEAAALRGFESYVLQFRGETKRAAEMARETIPKFLADLSDTEYDRNDHRTHVAGEEMLVYYWHNATALRDDALATGDYRLALDLIGRLTERISGTSMMRERGLLLTYAHTLLLAGETKRAHELLKSFLEHIEAEEAGRPEHWFAWERAAVFAMLGHDERALQQLAATIEVNRYADWWYMERDPVYANIRHDPRFQALAAKARHHRQQQRALLEKMRENGDVPRRS